MHLRDRLVVFDHAFECLAMHGAEDAALEIVFSQTDLFENRSDERDVVILAGVRRDEHGKFFFRDVVFLEPAVLDECESLERFGGGTPEHRQMRIADRRDDLAVAIDNDNVAAMYVLDMPRARVMQ